MRPETQIARRREWPSLLHGLGFGVGLAALADCASELLPVFDAIASGSSGLLIGAALAALTGFFFETSPPRSGSKDRQKDRIH